MNGYEGITVRTADSDVVSLSLSHAHYIMECGTNNILTKLVRGNVTA